uniref:GH18 domain-containing protein n=1 Tax=Mucochytrium quahogii TaxID=96639 RepID=A0A7S2RD83_9STRA|mmetsp:Transcript_4920/g.7452  ORF Transcript_4920/g.7452 Transcript_4920/m.7452 type:complete len:293 (+) Transcript_4920:59-937(+)|eukprot:CAMPEP_0203760124 /NCGR_PEP_ID=MMETSP0098-20131031/13497_1 /ASSEMBLY_ACC=CAM_ASM_000208 /TAXON_ID=96639 /ORGANISM=" , Strain NY0313808BC1" /LENGTH=292 /DNA_ID=CAMNT_0050653581 /DNA_START=16 /DNA_END=894 /DNA_ORIENTATION=+
MKFLLGVSAFVITVTQVHSDKIIGTYLGAWPGGRAPPALSSLPSEINLVMLSFSKDTTGTGTFVPFDGWNSYITHETIQADLQQNPKRKYLVSLGGAAAYGGTFTIKAGTSVDTWVSNAAASVGQIIESLGIQGAEMQFEGGTGDASFKPAMDGLLGKLKEAGYVTATGPFYGGTSQDYGRLNTSLIDHVNCQMYAMNINDVDALKNAINDAKTQLQVGTDKFIVGFDSGHRNPDPEISLKALQQMVGDVGGMFSWDAEDDILMTPAYCLETLSKQLFDGKAIDFNCKWPQS